MSDEELSPHSAEDNDSSGSSKEQDAAPTKASKLSKNLRVRRDISPREAKELVSGADVVDLDSRRINYDLKELSEFLAFVFPPDVLTQGEIAVGFHKPQAKHGLPIALSTLIKRASNSLPAGFYIGTSTLRLNDQREQLRFRKSNFERMFVVVLDDVGTKIDPSTLPFELEPSYILETSANNFQWGFVFEEPIADYDVAAAFMTALSQSGFTDTGGCAVVKQVRAPEGCHLKLNSKNPTFQTRVVPVSDKEKYGPVWSAEELFNLLKAPVLWSEVLADPIGARQTIKPTTAILRPTIGYTHIEGVVDILAEHLLETRQVTGDDGEFMAVICPRHEEHSNECKTAYYSPLGRGENPIRRGFHCHHSHEITIKEFIEHQVINEYAPPCAIIDYSGYLLASHAYIREFDSMVSLRTGMVSPSLSGFHNEFAMHDCNVIGYDPKTGKTKVTKTSATKLALNSPHRVDVDGLIRAPSESRRIIERNGSLYCNTYKRADYGTGEPDPKVVDAFYEYLEYLIPKEEERRVFIDWLTAKVKNPSFRGWGLIMYTPMTGTGRTTFMELIVSHLVAPDEYQATNYSALIDGNWNEHQAKSIVVVNEVERLKADGKDKGQRVLKDTVDTTIGERLINPKMGRTYTSEVVASYILLANVHGGTGGMSGDRRFYHITNTLTAAPPEFFIRMRKIFSPHGASWMERRAIIANIARHLKAREVDLSYLDGRAPTSEAKEAEEDELSTGDLIVSIIFGKYRAVTRGALFATLSDEEVVRLSGLSPASVPYLIDQTTLKLPPLFRINGPLEQNKRAKLPLHIAKSPDNYLLQDRMKRKGAKPAATPEWPELKAHAQESEKDYRELIRYVSITLQQGVMYD